MPYRTPIFYPFVSKNGKRLEKAWKNTFGFLEGLPTGRVMRCSISR